MKPLTIACLFTLVFAGAAASCMYYAMRDALTHRVDGSTYALFVLAVLSLLLGASAAIDALNRLELLP